MDTNGNGWPYGSGPSYVQLIIGRTFIHTGDIDLSPLLCISGPNLIENTQFFKSSPDIPLVFDLFLPIWC